jgi:tetratricopeptide (TPR) repeat protein
MTSSKRVKLSPSRLLRRGIALVDSGKARAAVKDFTAVLDQNRYRFLALLYRGDARWELRELEAAIVDWRAAARENKISALPYSRIGSALTEAGRYNDALKEFAVAIRKGPSDPDAWNGRGMTRFHLRDYQGAVDDYSKAIRRGRQRVRADVQACFWANRAEAELRLGDVVTALEDAKKAATLDQSDTFVRSILKAAMLASHAPTTKRRPQRGRRRGVAP